jgi:hypothetical protein
MDKGYPLMLVFYLDRKLMENREIMAPFANSVNDAIAAREANMMAFFVPTDGEERIECINPIMLEEPDMDRINKIAEDIAKQFDIGQGADDGKNDPDNEIDIDKE